MMAKDEKQPLQIAGASRALNRLIRAQQVYEALDEKLQPILPGSTKGHIRVACVDQSTLVMACASPAWASRARLESSRILDAARALWPEDLQQLKVIVSPGLIPPDNAS